LFKCRKTFFEKQNFDLYIYPNILILLFQLDKSAFTLAYPSAPGGMGEKVLNGDGQKVLASSSFLHHKLDPNGSGMRYSSGEELFRSTSRLESKVINETLALT
jgi:hypothetical protein